MKIRHTIAALAATAVALAAPAAASAATLTNLTVKPCYRGNGVLNPETNRVGGEPIVLSGTGFTPNGNVTVTANGRTVGIAKADEAGNISGAYRPVVARGVQSRSLTATDQTNPALTASLGPLRVSGVTINLRPKRGRPNRRFRIGARGFTTGKRLYAHIRRVGGRRARTVGIGRLRGPCRKLTARNRLFPRGVAPGTYRIQFDSKRRYSKKTKVKVVRGFRVSRRFG